MALTLPSKSIFVVTVGAWALGLGVSSFAAAKPQKGREITTASRGGETPGSVLIFSAQRAQEAPVPLDYVGQAKAIKSPLLFTQVRIKRSSDSDAGQLEVEEKATTIETKGAQRKKKSSPSKGKLAH